jgi:hypothetical protein
MQPTTLFASALAAATALWLAGKLFRRWAVAHFTIMADLPTLGVPRADGRKIGDTAIVCGGRCAHAPICSKTRARPDLRI